MLGIILPSPAPSPAPRLPCFAARLWLLLGMLGMFSITITHAHARARRNQPPTTGTSPSSPASPAGAGGLRGVRMSRGDPQDGPEGAGGSGLPRRWRRLELARAMTRRFQIGAGGEAWRGRANVKKKVDIRRKSSTDTLTLHLESAYVNNWPRGQYGTTMYPNVHVNLCWRIPTLTYPVVHVSNRSRAQF